MSESIFKVAFLFFLFSMPGQAQESVRDEHIKVAMRLIGDQVLASSGDLSSRVMPVTKVGDKFSISFEAEFKFKPAQLVNTIREVVDQADLARHYIVEVEQTETQEIVYSFEINRATQTELIPCAERLQPLAAYSLYFTIVDSSSIMAFASLWYLALIVPMLGIAAYLRNQRVKRKEVHGAKDDLISIGGYQLDKRRMLLSYGAEQVELSSRESELLFLLYSRKNEAIEREHLLHVVWGDRGNYIGRTLDVFVSKLRKRLSADENIRIINVRGYGYKLIC